MDEKKTRPNRLPGTLHFKNAGIVLQGRRLLRPTMFVICHEKCHADRQSIRKLFVFSTLREADGMDMPRCIRLPERGCAG